MEASIDNFGDACKITMHIGWDMLKPLSAAQYVDAVDNEHSLDTIKGQLDGITTPCPVLVTVPDIGCQQVPTDTSLYHILEVIREIVYGNSEVARKLLAEDDLGLFFMGVYIAGVDDILALVVEYDC